MAESEELLDEKEAIKRLNVALELQYRSVLQYSVVAASLTGMQVLALGPQLTEYGDRELSGARTLIEKIVSFGGEPTTEVAALKHETDPEKALAWLVDCEQEAIEALQAAIEPTGREGRSEALEHMLEHQIMRKQEQADFLARALAA
ncbi:MAG TPA: ferritin-like domain-containing protein [Solirubrobacterales bacterium]|nr:ferritin-like domain-containing protein [Solirubrobacterales bacterium]